MHASVVRKLVVKSLGGLLESAGFAYRKSDEVFARPFAGSGAPFYYKVTSESESAETVDTVETVLRDPVLPFFERCHDLESVNRGINHDGLDTSNGRILHGLMAARLARDREYAAILSRHLAPLPHFPLQYQRQDRCQCSQPPRTDCPERLCSVDTTCRLCHNTAMIPPFRSDGSLPPGVHQAEDWDEIVLRFGFAPERQLLLAKLRAGLDNLRNAGCSWILLDGSFATDKVRPNDVDGCWEYTSSIDLAQLDSAFLLRSRSDRLRLKQLYGMDFFVAGLIEAESGRPFAEFFQSDRNGNPRGIVRLDLT
ncbi:MAG TPA: hypothetical protein VFJ58_16015 [Armatimonadota bacterium]|nr:hypothetical protein [Armatimonadota bacterium]